MSPFRRSRGWAAAIFVAALTLIASAPASAGVLEEYQRLAERRLSPAPLVPTTVPRNLRPIDRTIQTLPTRRRGGYGFRFQSDAVDAVVGVEGGQSASIRAALREFRGARRRSTRVRGRRGYLLTTRVGRRRSLLWAEGGVVYSVESGTPRTISLRELRATASDLERLEGSFSGTDALGENSAFVVTTSGTATASVDFTAECTRPDGSPAPGRAGAASATLLPRQGQSFAFDIAENLTGTRPFPWQGTVSGTVDANGGTVDMRATLSDEGDTCDTGQKSLTLSGTR